MAEQVFQLYTRPGIKRDGTNFDSDEYTEGVWTRFNRGRPRKVRGYSEITPSTRDICRGGFLSSNQGQNLIAAGWYGGIQSIQQQKIVGGAGIADYKLPSQFVSDKNNSWSFDAVVDTSGSGNPLQLLAHASPNLFYIDTNVDTNVFYGNMGNTTATMNVLMDATILAAQANTTAASTTVATVAGNPFSLTGAATPFLAVFSSSTTEPNRLSPSYASTALYNGTNTVITATGTVQFPDERARVGQRIETEIKVSGGVVQLHPFTFVYGDNGLIKNNDPTADVPLQAWETGLANEVNASSSKIVAALPIRGGSASPSGLFWSLDSLIRVSFTGATVNPATGILSQDPFRYDIVSADTTIISTKTPVEVDGIYYWIGVDRFYIYNGVVQELPNDKNINYFFDGLTYEFRQKVWGLPVKRWGEIWWFYPRDGASECNDVLIYNYREKLWYDLGKAIGCRRSFGIASRISPYPVMMGNEYTTRIDDEGMAYQTTSVWEHEKGVNEVSTLGERPIRAFIETSDFSWSAGGPTGRAAAGDPFSTRITRIEPDFNLNGTLKLTVRGRKYPQDKDYVSTEYIFDSTTSKIDMREQRRLIRIGWESNDLDGDFELGRMLIHAEQGDARPAGG